MSNSWNRMQTQQEQIIALDANDQPLRGVDKFAAHRAPGVLHRAITVVLLNHKNEWLVTQRSAHKPLWPLWWDASCSTHQWWPDEDDIACAKRRLPFELGIDAAQVTDWHVPFAYKYHAVYSDEWAENEWNHIVVGRFEGELTLNPNEVAQCEWKALTEIQAELAQPNHRYAPWFPFIVERWEAENPVRKKLAQ